MPYGSVYNFAAHSLHAVPITVNSVLNQDNVPSAFRFRLELLRVCIFQASDIASEIELKNEISHSEDNVMRINSLKYEE